MKVMFVSDIHGSLDDAERLLNVFKREKADRLIILGDILYHGPRNNLPDTYNPSEVAKLLNNFSQKIIAVKGNCDSEVDQMVLNFEIMQEHSHLLIDGHHFFLTHGHKYDPNHLPKLEDGSILVSGHTHVMMLQNRGDIVAVNPGSVSLPKDNNPKSYAIYEQNKISIKTFTDEILHSMNI